MGRGADKHDRRAIVQQGKGFLNGEVSPPRVHVEGLVKVFRRRGVEWYEFDNTLRWIQ